MNTAGDKKSHGKNVYDLEFQDQAFEIRELFPIFDISRLKMLERIQRWSCLYDVYNQPYERSCTNVFHLHFQGQSDFGFSEMLDIVNVKNRH